MSTDQVEILKIGTIISDNKKTIMIVCDGGPIFDFYVSCLIDNCKSEYSFQRTAQSIVGQPNQYWKKGNQPANKLFGNSDGCPVVGKPFTINNSSWHTSRVERIIDDFIIITKNSVYAIHDVSKFRDKKLNDLGL